MPPSNNSASKKLPGSKGEMSWARKWHKRVTLLFLKPLPLGTEHTKTEDRTLADGPSITTVNCPRPTTIDSGDLEHRGSPEAPKAEPVGLEAQQNACTSATTYLPLVQRDAPVNDLSMKSVSNAFFGKNNGTVSQETYEAYFIGNLPTHPDISAQLANYFPGSRTDDLEHVEQWINTGNPPEFVFCVLGNAGIGKTTFATQLAAQLRESEQLAAEIYFEFANSFWTPELVIRMIAGQLCKAHNQLQREISDALRLDVGPSVSLEVRIKTLVVNPIRSLALHRPLVIVLDAVDQWGPHSTFLKALRFLAGESHLIRVIVFGRPGLERSFKGVTLTRHELQGVPQAVMVDYLNDQFSRMDWDHQPKPDPQTISLLAQKAQGLFIWSSTLCSLLDDRLSYPDPHGTIAAILQSRIGLGDSDVLAQLCHRIIELRFPKVQHKDKLRIFLGAVLVLQEPLPVDAFATLVSMHPAEIRRMQSELGPLYIMGPEERPDSRQSIHPATATFHRFVLDYFRSPSTPNHLAFPIDVFATHAQLGKACLNQLTRLPQLSSTIIHISPVQQYAAKYWAFHTSNGTPQTTPSSNVEWEGTPHRAALSNLTRQQWLRWANVYLYLVFPESRGNGLMNVITDTEDPSPSHCDILFGVVRRLEAIERPEAGSSSSRTALLEMATRLDRRDPSAEHQAQGLNESPCQPGIVQTNWRIAIFWLLLSSVWFGQRLIQGYRLLSRSIFFH